MAQRETFAGFPEAMIEFLIELHGESLKRPPRGFDAEHPLVEHLKRKDHIAVATLDHAQLMSPKATQLVADRFAAAKAYAKFQCEALELPF